MAVCWQRSAWSWPAGHAGAGHALPPLPELLVTGILIGEVFVVLADKQRTPSRLLLASIGTQEIFHAVFVLSGTARPAA